MALQFSNLLLFLMLLFSALPVTLDVQPPIAQTSQTNEVAKLKAKVRQKSELPVTSSEIQIWLGECLGDLARFQKLSSHAFPMVSINS
jgi:hypothetical protein